MWSIGIDSVDSGIDSTSIDIAEGANLARDDPDMFRNGILAVDVE